MTAEGERAVSVRLSRKSGVFRKAAVTGLALEETLVSGREGRGKKVWYISPATKKENKKEKNHPHELRSLGVVKSGRELKKGEEESIR